MSDERDEQYKPWQRDTGATPAPTPTPTAKPTPTSGPGVAKPRDVRGLSADELLARPAPLPTDAVAEGPGAGERLREGLGKLRDWAKATNERIEPGRRAREAGAAALSGGRKAASAVASSTAEAAGKLKEGAAPKVKAAAEAVQRGVAKGGAAAREGLGKGAASARETLSKGADQAKTQIGKGAETAREKLREAMPKRPEPEVPASELDRLIEREGLSEAAPEVKAAATPSPAPNLPLFGGAPVPEPAAPPPPAPPVAPAVASVPTPTMVSKPAAIAAQPPVAPLAEALQEQADEEVAPPPLVRATEPTFDAGALGLSQWARHPATWVLAGLALLGAGFGIGRWSNGAGIGEAVEAHIMANPDIVPRAMERLQANRNAEAIGRVRTDLTTPFSGAWTGNASGDVTVTVFTDYACTFCRASLPDLDRLVRDDRNVKIVFRELPILSADSEAAARVALVAAQRGRYMPVHQALFRAQVPDAAARTRALTTAAVNVTPPQLSAAEITRELENNVALARTIGVDGTPAWVIGDQLLSGAVGYARLRAAVAAARE